MKLSWWKTLTACKKMCQLYQTSWTTKIWTRADCLTLNHWKRNWLCTNGWKGSLWALSSLGSSHGDRNLRTWSIVLNTFKESGCTIVTSSSKWACAGGKKPTSTWSWETKNRILSESTGWLKTPRTLIRIREKSIWRRSMNSFKKWSRSLRCRTLGNRDTREF